MILTFGLSKRSSAFLESNIDVINEVIEKLVSSNPLGPKTMFFKQIDFDLISLGKHLSKRQNVGFTKRLDNLKPTPPVVLALDWDIKTICDQSANFNTNSRLILMASNDQDILRCNIPGWIQTSLILALKMDQGHIDTAMV